MVLRPFRRATHLGIVALFAAGCAGPSAQSPASAPEAQRPDRSRIIAVGMSPESREQARLRAQTEVSNQISSSIQSEFGFIEDWREQGGADDQRRRYVEEVRVRTRFEHADLMREVRYEMKDGLHVVTVELVRRVADEQLAAECAADRNKFDVALARARRAAHARDREGLAVAWRTLLEAAVPLDAIDVQRRAIRQGPVPDQEARLQALAEMLTAAAEARERVLLVFAPDRSADAVPEVVGQLAEEATKLKLRTRLANGGSACPVRSGDEDLLEVRVLTEKTCRWGQLGHQCTVRGRLTGRACAGGAELFQREADGVGVSPGREDRALASAQSQLSPKLRDLMTEALAAQVPLPWTPGPHADKPR